MKTVQESKDMCNSHFNLELSQNVTFVTSHLLGYALNQNLDANCALYGKKYGNF